MRRMCLSVYLLYTLILTACGSNSLGTAVGNPPSNGGKAAGAVSALFSSDNSTNLSAAIKKPVTHHVSSDPNCNGTSTECMCAEVEAGTGGPSEVDDALFGDPGTYGSTANAVTIAAEDFCTLPNGTENAIDGIDGKGRFAAFELTADITATCLDGAIDSTLVMKAGSSGIWRNTDAVGDTPVYQPQIFGTFGFESDGESFTLNCAIFLDENGITLLADCSDSSGNPITQEDGISCNFPSD